MLLSNGNQAISQYEAYQNALGVRSISFFRPQVYPGGALDERLSTLASPLVAIGSFDGNIRMISTLSYKVAFVFPCIHPHEMEHIGVNHSDGINDVVMNVEVLDQGTSEEDEGSTLMSFTTNQNNSSTDYKSSAYSTK